jgi:hypothetical protein
MVLAGYSGVLTRYSRGARGVLYERAVSMQVRDVLPRPRRSPREFEVPPGDGDFEVFRVRQLPVRACPCIQAVPAWARSHFGPFPLAAVPA